MQCERLHLGALLSGHTSARGHIGITGAVDDHLGTNAHQPVLVCDDDGGDASSGCFCITDDGIEEHRKLVATGLQFAVQQHLELKGVRDRRVVRCDLARVRLAHARFRQQFQSDAAHDDAMRLDVSNSVKVGQANAGDDAACERSLLHQQRACSVPRCAERRRRPRAAAAADEHVCFDLAHRCFGEPLGRSACAACQSCDGGGLDEGTPCVVFKIRGTHV